MVFSDVNTALRKDFFSSLKQFYFSDLIDQPSKIIIFQYDKEVIKPSGETLSIIEEW